MDFLTGGIFCVVLLLVVMAIGMQIGLAFEAFADVGRAWEGEGGVAFPADLRYGAGTGLMLTLDRVPVGRLEVSVGDEGIFPAASFGAAF